MQAFHSNWTRPFFIRNPHMEYRIEPFELLTTALSALEWRRENGSIRMICDTPAKRYYESLGLCFLWDDGVYPLLDTMPEDINATAFWAAGKLYALSCVPLPRARAFCLSFCFSFPLAFLRQMNSMRPGPL